MNMIARQRIKSPEYHHMICIGKTKCTSEKGLFSWLRSDSFRFPARVRFQVSSLALVCSVI